MLTEANVEQIIHAVKQNVAGLSESLSQCFDVPRTLTPGDAGTWDVNEADDLQGSGLVAMFEVGGQGVAVLIPDTLPLPSWYNSPNESQKARLETLSMEWSMNLFPPDLESSRFATVHIPNLQDFIRACQPLDWAATLPLNVSVADGAEAGSLLMVWPLAAPRWEAPSTASPAMTDAAPVGNTVEPTPDEFIPEEIAPIVATGPDPLIRLRSLPVQVSVRLAEKKITVSQLLSIANGSLITFPKSCEALLDLYVNNARYCRGEAVKIGENFGLKINDVGTTEERASKILN